MQDNKEEGPGESAAPSLPGVTAFLRAPDLQGAAVPWLQRFPTWSHGTQADHARVSQTSGHALCGHMHVCACDLCAQECM